MLSYKINPKAANLIAEALDAEERTERFLRQMIPSIGLQGKVADEDCEAPLGDGNSAMTVALWPVQNQEIEELKRRTDALEKRAAALEKEIVLLVWAIAAAAAAVAAVLLVCM